jgi:hypothetical protein
MVSGLLGALFIIAIICIVAGLIIKLAPLPEPVPVILWAVVAIICIVLLAQGLGVNIGLH